MKNKHVRWKLTSLEFPVTVEMHRARFTIVYGVSKYEDLTYAEASKQLGACLMHNLHCTGKLDEEV